MTNTIKSLLLCAVAISTCEGAEAQRYYARERLHISTEAANPTPPTTTPAGWKTSEWSAWSSSCSQDALRTRDVFCSRGSERVADSECSGAGARPAFSEGPKEVTESCTYGWKPGPPAVSNSYCDGSTKTLTQSVFCFDRNDYTFNKQVNASSCAGQTKPATVTTQVPCTNLGVTYPVVTGSVNGSATLPVSIFPGVLTKAEIRTRGLAMCEAEGMAAGGVTNNDATYCKISRYYTSASSSQTAVQAGIRPNGDVPPSGGDWKYTPESAEAVGYRTYRLDTSGLEIPAGWTCENKSSSPYWRRTCG